MPRPTPSYPTSPGGSDPTESGAARIGRVPAHADALAILAVCLLTLLFCLPMLAGRIPYLLDTSTFFLPAMSHVARTLHDGLPALWNPAALGGYFAHGGGQASMMYPVNWAVYRLLPMPWAYSFNLCLHLAWASLGFYLLLRINRIAPLSAILGAALYAFNGHVAAQHVTPNVLLTLAWLPWVLVTCHRAVRASSPATVALFGLAYGAMAVAGHPQWLWLASVVVALYVLVGLSAEGTPMRRRLGVLALGGTLAVFLAAVQILPTAATAWRFERTPAEPLEFVRTNSLTLSDVPRLLFPNVHGNAMYRRPHWPSAFQWCGTAAFQGAVALCMVVFFFAAYRWGPLGWFALVLILVGVLMACGQRNPLYRAFAPVPLLGSFRVPGRYLLLTVIGVAVAAAKGHDAVVRGCSVRRPRAARWAALGIPMAVVVLTVLCNVVFAGFTWAWQAPLDPSSLRVPEKTLADVVRNYFVGWEPVVIALAAVVAGAWLGLREHPWRRYMAPLPVALAVAELAVFWHSCLRTAPASYYLEPPAYLAQAHEAAQRQWGRLLIARAPLERLPHLNSDVEVEEAALTWGFWVLGGLDPLGPRDSRYRRNRAVHALTSGIPEGVALGRRLCNLFGIRWIVSTQDLSGSGLSLMPGSDCVYENPEALPLAYVATNVVPVWHGDNPERLIEAEAFQPGVDCVADHSLLSYSAPGRLPRPPTCEILAHKPGRLVVRVRSASPGILVYQQDWHPGWRATVNGQPARAVRCNAINVGVPLPANPEACEVEVTFVSRLTQIGGAVSLAATGLCLVLVAVGIPRQTTRFGVIARGLRRNP